MDNYNYFFESGAGLSCFNQNSIPNTPGVHYPYTCLGYTTSMESYTGSLIFSVAPNPSNGIFAIKAAEPIEEIEIYDLSGNVCYYNVPLHGEKSISLDLHNRPAGIYFIRLRSGNQISAHKLLLEK